MVLKEKQDYQITSTTPIITEDQAVVVFNESSDLQDEAEQRGVNERRIASVNFSQAEEKDNFSDAVIEINGVPVTTSLKIAEIFEKSHDNVIKAIRKAQKSYEENGRINFNESVESQNAIDQGKINAVKNPFVQSTYKDAKGEERLMYYLTEAGFSFVVMGFTGEKAATWKWKYIAAFETMRKELEKRNAPKPMTHLEVTLANAQALVDHEKRLTIIENNLKKLQGEVHSPFSDVRIKQMDHDIQIQNHEDRIMALETFEQDNGPAEEIKILISDAKKKYNNLTYEYLWQEFYRVLRERYNIDINRRLSQLKKRRLEQGWSQSKVNKVSKLDTITASPDVWKATRAMIT